MRYFLQIFLLLSFHVCLAQTNELEGLSPFHLGDPIVVHLGRIECTAANNTSPCLMYRLLSPSNEYSVINGITLDEIKISVGVNRAIKNIYWFKYYKGTDSSYLVSLLERDYNLLVDHFKNRLFRKKNTASKSQLRDMNWETNRWKMKGYSFSVQRQTFKRREDGYAFLISIMAMGK